MSSPAAAAPSTALVEATEAFVRRELAGQDSSHDFWHIHRVRNLALTLAREERLPAEQLEVVQLAALLHDLHDWKYSGSATAGAEAAAAWLRGQGYAAAPTAQVVAIIQRIGFKDELAAGSQLPVFPELAVVQDADRLDAIGAVGIARCLTFGGHFNRVLHDPEVKARDSLTKEQYTDTTAKQTTMNHFPEKLLKLRGMMKTEAGRRMAEGRHRTMEKYLADFYAEWDGAQ